jgi:hypothetical protein
MLKRIAVAHLQMPMGETKDIQCVKPKVVTLCAPADDIHVLLSGDIKWLYLQQYAAKYVA